MIMAEKEKPHAIFELKDTPKIEAVATVNTEEKSDIYGEFEKERVKWKDIIISMANKLKYMDKISEVQVELYSNRQICLEHSHYLQSLLAKVNKNYKKSSGVKWTELMNDDRKRKMGETNILVDAATAEYKEKIDNIQSQIEYMQETIKTIDNIIYGIKYRIQMEEYRRTS